MRVGVEIELKSSFLESFLGVRVPALFTYQVSLLIDTVSFELSLAVQFIIETDSVFYFDESGSAYTYKNVFSFPTHTGTERLSSSEVLMAVCRLRNAVTVGFVCLFAPTIDNVTDGQFVYLFFDCG